ncbi:MAG TPA: peptide deformylase [Candidatus Portnoybacteria bacterium]|nr:peptide deformylase [Candidatus Portnoybacteria bacterium]
MEIKFYPDPILRVKTKPIKNINPEIKKIISKMSEIMQQKDGAGLAGPQVGITQQIFLADDGSGLKIFINPKIIWRSDKQTVIEEGCLSFPGIFLEIKRPKEIKIKFTNEKGEEKEIQADGLLARIIQHEYDHLQGVLFIDRVGLFEKLKIRKKLESLEKVFKPSV